MVIEGYEKNNYHIIISFTALFAQAKNPDVKGVVVGTDGQPIPFVNVVLLSADSTFVQGATSEEKGSFNIVTTATDGILKVTSVGYETTFINDRRASIRVRVRAKRLPDE